MEGEITILELLNALKVGGKISHVKGIAYRDKKRVKLTNPHPPITNLDSLLFPAFEYFPLKKYKGECTLKNVRMLPISTSRGCPFHCTFCSRVSGSAVRTRSVDNVIAEIKRDIEKFGITHLHFTDETFTLNRKRVIDFCNKMISEGLSRKISWTCFSHVDTVDKFLLKKMKMAGCALIKYGIESGDESILVATKKGITSNQARRATKLAKEAGIKVWNFFILGFSGETKWTVIKTIKFAEELDSDYISFATLIPYPGTDIYNSIKSGALKLLTRDWKKYAKHLGSVLETKTLSAIELNRLQQYAHLKFYGKVRKIKNLLEVTDIKALCIYILKRLGIGSL